MKKILKFFSLLFCIVFVLGAFAGSAFAYSFNKQPYITVPEDTIHVSEGNIVKIKVKSFVSDGSDWSWENISYASVQLLDCDKAGGNIAAWTDYEEEYDHEGIMDSSDGNMLTTIFPYAANKGTHYLIVRLSVEIGGGPSFNGGDAAMVYSIPIKVVVGEEATKATTKASNETKSTTKATDTTKSTTSAATTPVETSPVETSAGFNPISIGTSGATTEAASTEPASLVAIPDIVTGQSAPADAEVATDIATSGITISPLALGIIIGGGAALLIGGVVVIVILLTKKKSDSETKE